LGEKVPDTFYFQQTVILTSQDIADHTPGFTAGFCRPLGNRMLPVQLFGWNDLIHTHNAQVICSSGAQLYENKGNFRDLVVTLSDPDKIDA